MSLRLDAVSVNYGSRLAVDNASLTLEAGSLVALIGPNGAGKSSLLKAMGGILPCEGEIAWANRSIGSMPPDLRARTIAYLPQNRGAHWPMRVVSLVELGRLPHRRFGAAMQDADRKAVRSALDDTETLALADRPLDQLSGGESARVQLARALCVGAPILLVDEPIALLDPYHQLQIMTTLRNYAHRGGLVVAVLHDLTLAARFCDRVVLIDHGILVGDGTARQVLDESSLRESYGIEALLSRHEDEPVIVPWRRI